MVSIQSHSMNLSGQESLGNHGFDHGIFNGVSPVNVTFRRSIGHMDMTATPQELVNFRGAYDTTGTPKPPKPPK